jgi:hypothetical protein
MNGAGPNALGSTASRRPGIIHRERELEFLVFALRVGDVFGYTFFSSWDEDFSRRVNGAS